MGLPEFRNEPFTDFTTEDGRSKMNAAIAAVQRELGKKLSLVIGGEHVTTYDKFYSRSPSNQDEVVAVLEKGSPREVQRAVEAAEAAFRSWRLVPAEERAALLLRAADILRRRRYIAAAWQVYEVGKNWSEADADVAESIDHLEYFAREAIRYARGQPMGPHPRSTRTTPICRSASSR